MKLIFRILIIGAVTYLVSPYLTWWTGMVISTFICDLMPSSLLNAFISGFLGVGLVWMGQAWVLDVANDSAFSRVIIQLFPIEDPILLILITGLIGGISGGLAATTGASFKLMTKKTKRTGYYS